MAANGLLLMTALPPTKGHAYLIDFAAEFLSSRPGGRLYVIINGRPHEPIGAYERYRALGEHFSSNPNIYISYFDQDIPQEPSEHPRFWEIWQELILRKTGLAKFDYVFASELYGVTLAETVQAEFIPFNIDRSIIPISATEVRADPIKHFAEILPEFQKVLRKTITVFGADSCGKTTLSKALSERLNSHFIPEWARGYLEAVGPDITMEKMETITRGQEAIQKSVAKLIDKPFIIRDTDLLTTYGYYKMWNKGVVPDECYSGVIRNEAHVYILMPDDIPFEADPLRYGGDKRESGRDYWENLLVYFGFRYYKVQSFYPKSQVDEVEKYCLNFFEQENNLRFIR